MSNFDDYLRELAEKEFIEMPISAQKCIDKTLASLPEKPQPESIGKSVFHFSKVSKILSTAACIAFVLLFLLPNVNVAYAKEIEKIPVIGKFVKVITIRNYTYQDDRYEMDVNVPEIETENPHPSTENINQEVSEMTRRLVDRFYEDLELSGNNGYGSLNVEYKTVTNTDQWFTLKLSVTEIAASSNKYYKYYHIDKNTGDITTLEDLFTDDSYNQILTGEIIRQMKKQMAADSSKSYWINDSGTDSEFSSLSATHNFYFNDNGQLVIPFDQFEVGPGSMGTPEFVIEKSVIRKILKDEYVDMIK